MGSDLGRIRYGDTHAEATHRNELHDSTNVDTG